MGGNQCPVPLYINFTVMSHSGKLLSVTFLSHTILFSCPCSFDLACEQCLHAGNSCTTHLFSPAYLWPARESQENGSEQGNSFGHFDATSNNL